MDAKRAMDQAQLLADKGRFEDARATLVKVRDVMREANTSWSEAFVEDLDLCQQDMSNSFDYRSGGKQRLASKSHKHATQRANHCSAVETKSAPISSNMYMNARKGKMKKAFFS